MKRILFFAFIVVVTLQSCVKAAKAPLDLTKETDSINIAVKECITKTYIDNTTIQYCFDSLVHDSRCPDNAICIWQGVAIAKFSITINNTNHQFNLGTLNFSALSTKTDTTISSIKIHLENITPYPITTSPINYNTYRAILKVSK